MNSISEKLKDTLKSKSVKNKEKLKKQQEYYQRLRKSGIAQKQTYNLKPLSAI